MLDDVVLDFGPMLLDVVGALVAGRSCVVGRLSLDVAEPLVSAWLEIFSLLQPRKLTNTKQQI